MLMSGSLLIAAALLAGLLLSWTWIRCRRGLRDAAARLRAGSALLETPQGVIEYACEGDGPPVLSLHGAGGGYHQGLWVARLAFGGRHKLIAVSRYGYLRSPIPPDASLRTQAELYRALLDHLGVAQAAVIGTSAGGPSATQFANDYPERTTALILLSAVSRASLPGDQAAFYSGIIHLIQRSDYAYWLVTRFLRAVILRLLGIPAEVYARLSPEQKDLAREMLDTMHPMSPRRPGTLHDGAMLARAEAATARIAAPTLILHAQDDALVSCAHARHAHGAIPHSRLVLFEAGGHGLLPQLDAVRRHVRELLA